MKSQCPKCQKSFRKPTVNAAEQALRMHMMRAHGPARSGMRVGCRTGRLGKRRMKSVESVCFCPRCGLNIQTLAVAMLVTENNK